MGIESEDSVSSLQQLVCMSSRRSPQIFLTLFASKTVIDLPMLKDALGGSSAMTVGRWLRQISYRRSYNHNGRYYALHESARYDRHGLWSYGDIHFSIDGSLKNTVRRMVRQAEAGATHQELASRLRVRVHNALLGLVREDELVRIEIDGLYHYVHADPEVQRDQLHRRKLGIDAAAVETSVDHEVIIRVLLVLLRHPGARPGEVVRYLVGRAPPITRIQVDVVFTRYGLGEKGGPSIY